MTESAPGPSPSPGSPSPSFQDHFSGHAGDYAASRPRYPEALFDWLAEIAPARDHVVDVGTGNGQAAVSLAGRFGRVTATDASRTQIDHAEPVAGVTYHVAEAESLPVASGTADLVTVAQALHWFDAARFGLEVERVLRPGGVLAAWTYALCTVDPGIDAAVGELYEGIVGPFWPERRRLVEEGYASIPLPGTVIAPPPIEMAVRWTLGAYRAYLRTWSAVQRYEAERGHDPVGLVEAALSTAWGDPAAARLIRWPITVQARQLPHG